MQSSEPVWLTAEIVVTVNADVIAASPHPEEKHLILDLGRLEGALARANNIYAYESHDIVDMAVALLFGIATAHAFEQGNKRTAFVAVEMFLNVNGYEIASDVELIAEWMLETMVPEGRSVESFAELFRAFVVPIT